MSKKFLSVLLTLCMVVSLVPSSVFAAPTAKGSVEKSTVETVVEEQATEEVAEEQVTEPVEEQVTDPVTEQPDQQVQPEVQVATVEKTVVEETVVEETVVEETVTDTAELATQAQKDVVLRKFTNNDYPVYVAVRQDGNMPGEPSVQGAAGYSFFSSNYSSNGTNTFARTANGVISTSIVDDANFFFVSVDGSRTVGLAGVSPSAIKAYVTGVDWDRLYTAAVATGRVRASDGTLVTSSNSSRYQLVPYVIKLQETDGKGWHIDVAVVPKESVTLTYNINLLGLTLVTSGVGVPNSETQSRATSTTPVTFGVDDMVGLPGNDTVTVAYNGTNYQLKFTGWNTKADGSGTSYAPGSDITITSDTVIYAQWVSTKTVEISGEKTWVDGNDQDGIRPDYIEVKVLNGTTVVKTIRVTPDRNNNWSYTVEDLPEYTYSNGTFINYTYTVEEVAVTGYESEVEGYNIKNTHVVETADVTVSKIWDDNRDQDGLRPDSIEVQLYANNKVYGNPVTLNADNSWSYTYEGLDVNADGEAIIYTVDETSVPAGYEKSVEGLVITNSHTPAITTFTVTKVWEDDSDRDNLRPDSVQVQLYADDEAYGDPVTLSEANEWTYTFENLPEKSAGTAIVYTVDETSVPTGYTKAVADGVITNTHEIETTEITVTKIWEDADDQDGVRPDSITVVLLADGEEVSSATLTAEEDWAYTFEDLPVYADGEEIEYTVEEVEVAEGYESEVDGFVITNTHEIETTEITVTKAWEDDDNRDGLRPDSVTVQLYADGEEVGEPVEVTAEEDWAYTFEDLPVYADGEEIEYTVEEVDVAEGYESEVDGFVITNTHESETTSVSGSKTWDDNDDQDGVRPESITINLLANGEVIDSVEVTEEDDWAWTFEDLYVYANGEEIVYTVSEETVEGYTPEYDGFDVTNSYTPEETYVEVQKVWADDDNRDGVRPESVEVQLYADGEAVEGKVAVLNGENSWRAVFTELAKYRDGGTPIVYTVKEVEVAEGYADGYETAENVITVTNTHVSETTSLAVGKVWDDGDNKDGLRPDSVKVQLYADGAAVGEAVVLDTTNGWAYTWTDLYVYANGEEISYTVAEVEVAEGYEAVVEYSEKGVVITNKHTPKADPTPDTTPTPQPPVTPDTGDTSNTMLWFVLMLASALGLGGTVLFRKKEEQ